MPPRRGTTTPWASSRGSLPSDRIRPPQPAQPAPPTKSDKGKGKAKAAAPEPPRSAAVRKLDELLADLRSSSPSGPTQHNNNNNKNATAAAADSAGCFCQARAHALSEYTPLCTACGLVLCSLHPPHRPCPHCAKPLLAPPARAALIVQLEEQRARALAEEAAAREREAVELRLAEGAFPALNTQRGGAPAAPAVAPGGAQPQHRVLSVDARTKRVKVEAPARLLSGARGTLEEEEEGEEAIDVPRVPPPPREVEYVRVRRRSATRWTDLKGDGAAGAAKYVVPPSLPASSRAQSEHARGRGKGKDKGRPPVPGAPAT